MADDTVTNHERACNGFAEVAAQVQNWDAPSPCSDWDARGVVEHVIGFHEVLVLRPLGVKADRPRENPVARWKATQAAIVEAMSKPGALDEEVDMGGGNKTGLGGLVGTLSTDVLVHSWDLAKAGGVEPKLDTELCTIGYERAEQNREMFAKSDMFSDEVKVSDDADVCSKL